MPHTIPLAARIRPQQLDEYVGHTNVVGPGTPLRIQIEHDCLQSFIIWAPPASGKTTLARIIATQTHAEFIEVSATSATVKDLRTIIALAHNNPDQNYLVFIDEIHRFSKAQQDTLLHAIEEGTLTLIGATTENPSFSVNRALLSRLRVIHLEALTRDDIATIIKRAIVTDKGLKQLGAEFSVSTDAIDQLATSSAGDARWALTALESAALMHLSEPSPIKITKADIIAAAPVAFMTHDRSGDDRYDVISAFHKSIRNSDADAALFWLAHMLESGEDPLYPARRMVRIASEDVGLADPHALTVAVSAYTATSQIGYPECDCVLAECASYLALAPKSNAVELAIHKAEADVRNNPQAQVPMQIRNAPTELMKTLGYHQGYRYAHDYPEHIATQKALPDVPLTTPYYEPQGFGQESPSAPIGRYHRWVKQWHTQHDAIDDIQPKK